MDYESDGDLYKIAIPRKYLEQIIIAENNELEASSSEIKKYQNNMRSINELKDDHIIIWFIGNLLL